MMEGENSNLGVENTNPNHEYTTRQVFGHDARLGYAYTAGLDISMGWLKQYI